MDRVSLDLSTTEEETTEKTSVAKASIMLILLQWEEIADLTSSCAVCSLGRAGLARGWAENMGELNEHLCGYSHPMVSHGHLQFEEQL